MPEEGGHNLDQLFARSPRVLRPPFGKAVEPLLHELGDQLEATVAQLTEIVASGAYERHAGAAARF